MPNTTKGCLIQLKGVRYNQKIIYIKDEEAEMILRNGSVITCPGSSKMHGLFPVYKMASAGDTCTIWLPNTKTFLIELSAIIRLLIWKFGFSFHFAQAK